MYILQTRDGIPALSTRTEEPLRYSELKYAIAAARILSKRDGRRYEVVAA